MKGRFSIALYECVFLTRPVSRRHGGHAIISRVGESEEQCSRSIIRRRVETQRVGRVKDHLRHAQTTPAVHPCLVSDTQIPDFSRRWDDVVERRWVATKFVRETTQVAGSWAY